MKRTMESSNSLGKFLSPGTSKSIQNGAFSHKGWYSERVPHPSTATPSAISWRCYNRGLTKPFYIGRTLPSKWEDAERWICSPVALYPPRVWENASTNSHFVEKRRHRSKSGPIVLPPEIGCYYCSPTVVPTAETPASARGLMVNSPFSTGVLMTDRVYRENKHRWMDLVSEASSDSSKEGDDTIDDENMVSAVVSRRDMATQMSPPEAISPNESPPAQKSCHCSSPPLVISAIDPQQETPSKPQVREVKVDEGANTVRGSSRQGSKATKRDNKNVVADNYASSWSISESAMSIPKIQREEAKITAWENLQMAKAEAAIRKLEMQLERQRSASMDKIMNKLQKAQLKAQDMRSSVSSRQECQIRKNTNKKITSFRKRTFTRFMSGCFTRRIDCRSSFSI